MSKLEIILLVIAIVQAANAICLGVIAKNLDGLKDSIYHKETAWETASRLKAEKDRRQGLEIAEMKILWLEEENKELKIRNDELNKFFGGIPKK